MVGTGTSFGFVPNLELPLLLGCRIEGGSVCVDRWQETSVAGVYAAGETTGIAGLDAAIPQAASECKLFSDLGLPWAHRTETFDLTGYKQFPVQFTPADEADAPVAGGLPFE